MTTDKNKVSELLVSDERLFGGSDGLDEGLNRSEVRDLYEAELARLRQERDELVGALENLVYCIAGDQHDHGEISKAFCPVVADAVESSRFILSKHKPE